jgi:hypothetical protein
MNLFSGDPPWRSAIAGVFSARARPGMIATAANRATRREIILSENDPAELTTSRMLCSFRSRTGRRRAAADRHCQQKNEAAMKTQISLIAICFLLLTGQSKADESISLDCAWRGNSNKINLKISNNKITVNGTEPVGVKNISIDDKKISWEEERIAISYTQSYSIDRATGELINKETNSNGTDVVLTAVCVKSESLKKL